MPRTVIRTATPRRLYPPLRRRFETALLVLGGAARRRRAVSGWRAAAFLSLTALFVLGGLRARHGGLEVLDFDPRSRVRGGAGDRRADRDPVPRRPRGRGRDAPDARGACRCASSCSAMPITAALVARRHARADRPRLDRGVPARRAAVADRPGAVVERRHQPARAAARSATRSTSSRGSTTGSRCRRARVRRRARASTTTSSGGRFVLQDVDPRPGLRRRVGLLASLAAAARRPDREHPGAPASRSTRSAWRSPPTASTVAAAARQRVHRRLRLRDHARHPAARRARGFEHRAERHRRDRQARRCSSCSARC